MATLLTQFSERTFEVERLNPFFPIDPSNTPRCRCFTFPVKSRHPVTLSLLRRLQCCALSRPRANAAQSPAHQNDKERLRGGLLTGV